MTIDDTFTEAARAEILSRLGHEAQRLDGGKRVTAFVAGAEWAASHPIPEDEAYCDRGPCWMHLGHDGPCQQDGAEMRGVMWERRREPTQEEIEAAAKALCAWDADDSHITWEGWGDDGQAMWREAATLALRAARGQV